MLPEAFLKYCKNNTDVTFNIPTDVKNHLKRMDVEQDLYSQLVMLLRKDLKITEEKKIKMKIDSSYRVSLKDHSVGLVLVLNGLRKILAHVNLVSIIKYFKLMMK